MEPFLDYRMLLKEELNSRRQRNKNYSARAFARDLKVAPSYLFNVLNGRKNLTEEKAIHLARSLRWPLSKRKCFTTLVRYSRTEHLSAKNEILNDLDTYRNSSFFFWCLPMDRFKIISEWYHYALLELTELEGFSSSSKWMSERLGLTQEQVTTAVRRLKEVGLLDVSKKPWKKTQGNYTTHEIPSEAIRLFHSQNLDLAKTAITTQNVNERDFSGITVAIDPAKLVEAKEKIRRFRGEMMELFGDSSKKSAVYQLSVQLFRLDKNLEKTQD